MGNIIGFEEEEVPAGDLKEPLQESPRQDPAKGSDDTGKFTKMDTMEFGLSVERMAEKRTSGDVMFALGLFVVYVGMGAWWAVHNKMTVVEYFYFVIVTLTTVGYGDYGFYDATETSPVKATFQVLFGCCFILLGITFVCTALSLVVGQVSSRVEEKMASTWGKVMDKEAEKRSTGARANAHSLAKLEAKNKQRTRELYRGLLGHVAIFVFLLIAGTISFYFLEKDWTWYQSLYYCVVTATTVGYGDLEPTTDLSKMVTVVFIILEFYFGANAIGYFSNMPSERRRQLQTHKVLTQFGADLKKSELEGLLKSKALAAVQQGNKKRQIAPNVNRAEFMIYMLMKQDKIAAEDLVDAAMAFDLLDLDNNGKLDQKDLNEAHSRLTQNTGV